MANFNHESYWPQVKELAEAQNYSGIEALAAKFSDTKEQIAFLRFIVRSLMFRDWQGKSLMPLVKISDNAIAKALAIGEIDEANVICYNMSANLADCWNDGFARNRETSLRGLDYAERALEYRRQLKKGPASFSLAYWAKGIHLFFLGEYSAAEENFKFSLDSAVAAAVAANQTAAIQAEAPFAVLIAHGYLALAQIASGNTEGRQMLEEVLSAFEKMKTISDDSKADAEVGLDQLNYVSKILMGK